MVFKNIKIDIRPTIRPIRAIIVRQHIPTQPKIARKHRTLQLLQIHRQILRKSLMLGYANRRILHAIIL